MKPLLFTFFAIVLCYSLFFDDGKTPSAVDEVNYIYEDASKTDIFTPDTSYYYSYFMPRYNPWTGGWKDGAVPFRF